MDKTTGSSHLTKNTIIHQHELLRKSVLDQRISPSDKQALLQRLENISKAIADKGTVTKDDLRKWNKQIAKIKDEAATASSKSMK